MSDRVSASIQIGGPVPADRLDDLIDAIDSEGLCPDWGAVFDDRGDILAHLANGVEGVIFRRHEVAAGEFDDLQALCVEIGLTYVLTYDGYGGEWGPARRIYRPGDAGDGDTCSLDRDDGRACVCADDIYHLGYLTLDQVLERLALFDNPHVPPLEIQGAPASGAAS